MESQGGFFDWQIVIDQLDKAGDPLAKLNKAINWGRFRVMLHKIRDKERKSPAGRRAYDVVLMFKILVLQSLYNLSDASVEYQVRDRISFRRFLGLKLGDPVPDEKTIWLFREQLGELGLVERAFREFEDELRKNGFSAKKGQIVDASIVDAPVQHNSRDENKEIKEGKTPEDWSENKKRQKDTDARWVKRSDGSRFGYKNHISVDVEHKLIRDYHVTDASVHDSNVFMELLDEENSSVDVWADSAYRTPGILNELEASGYRGHINRKGCRNRKLTEREKKGNHTRSCVRARIEHVFGVQTKRAGSLILRTIGIWRARIKIGLRNLAYNMNRYALLSSESG